uniref:Cation-transporting ATPase n=1 Tax=Naja naja TaxID=35670 RepID=A0A8C6XBE7_NAJNA
PPPAVFVQHANLSSQEVFGYKTGGFRRALCLAGYVLSCGGLLLLFHWKPEWDVWANCQPCSLEEADVVLLRSTVGASPSSEATRFPLWLSVEVPAERAAASSSVQPFLRLCILRRASPSFGGKPRLLQFTTVLFVWPSV